MTGVTCTTALTELNATSTAFMECIRYEMVHHAETASDILKVYNDHVCVTITFDATDSLLYFEMEAYPSYSLDTGSLTSTRFARE